MSWDWADNNFKQLPGTRGKLFDTLWTKRKLKFDKSSTEFDLYDDYGARLVTAALLRKRSLLLILPDACARRPALLLATALLQTWYQRRQTVQKTHPILYFGSTVGIRDQLTRTTVEGLGITLAEAFRQVDVKRHATAETLPSGDNRAMYGLPTLVTVYSPADPIVFVDQYKPEWIAIDIADAPSLPWLVELLACAEQTRVPVLAWTSNPLSDCVQEFANCGSVYRWPRSTAGNAPPRPSSHVAPSELFDAGQPVKIQAIPLVGASADTIASKLQAVGSLLAQIAKAGSGRLLEDTIAIHWKLLRSLESLSVPYDFYSAEARRFWGLPTFERLLEACARFRDACFLTYRAPATELTRVGNLLSDTLDILRSQDPPLWVGLSAFCVDEPPPHEARLVTFASKGRQQLFLLALLAKYNITEDDLAAMRIWVCSLAELKMWNNALPDSDSLHTAARKLLNSRHLQWRPMLVGLPSLLITPKLMPILIYPVTDVLAHEYQVNALRRRIAEWSRRMTPIASHTAQLIAGLCGIPPTTAVPIWPEQVIIGDIVPFDLGKGEKIPARQPVQLWAPQDPLAEITRLLRVDEDSEDETALEGSAVSRPERDESEVEPEWADTALEVQFSDNWVACYPPDQSVNVIVSHDKGLRLDERYVRSLRPGDRVLLIHGQQRQSLYDLILSRIHRHPSIELHLALIHRWRDDFVSAYQSWRRYQERNLDVLLFEMAKRGSTLTSSFTLRQWLWGKILGPDDAEDLRRLAEVLDMGFVKQYYRRIDEAAQRIRGLHRSLALRLNGWLKQQVSGIQGASDNEVIDDTLGLTFGDFRSSLLVLTVRATKNIPGPFLRESLGRLERSGNSV
jgi:hypothetical protein